MIYEYFTEMNRESVSIANIEKSLPENGRMKADERDKGWIDNVEK